MENEVTTLLKTLRAYALEKNLQAVIMYHEEDSYLMRLANSAISLNTNEHLVRLEFYAYDGRCQANYDMIADPQDVQGMRRGIDTLAEMLPHAEPLSYTPTFPIYQADVVDENAYDPALAALTNAERLEYFKIVAGDLESDDLKLSGIFANGTTTTAQISTAGEFIQFFRSTDAQITAVISSETQKWEVNAEQSAQKKSDLDPQALHENLALLVRLYQESEAVQLPLGKYRVVFGPAAIGEVMEILTSYATDGGAFKRGYSFLHEEDLGKQVLSEKITVVDDPRASDVFGQSADAAGLPRKPFTLFDKGKFNSFTWNQDSADEFGQTPTGHTVPHLSIVVHEGDWAIGSLRELVDLPRGEDILYVPYIHYMNMVNPSQGLITGTSRFGALLLKADGSVQVPYNVRLTQKLTDFFGEGVEWLSDTPVVYNLSSSYGQRNPTAIKIPSFICVRDIEISHSNSSY